MSAAMGAAAATQLPLYDMGAAMGAAMGGATMGPAMGMQKLLDSLQGMQYRHSQDRDDLLKQWGSKPLYLSLHKAMLQVALPQLPFSRHSREPNVPSLSYPIAGIAGIAGYLTCNPRRGAPRAVASIAPSFASSALRASDSRYSSSLSLL